MQMIIDEPIEGYDNFETIRESKIEGKIEAQKETALNMLKNHLSDDLILSCSGISPEMLENLKKQITEE